MRAFSLLALLAPACALLLPGTPLGSAASPCRTRAVVSMRHNDYARRVSRSLEGRLRLCVHRTNNHIYAQVVDDSKGFIIASASTIEQGTEQKYGGNCEAAVGVGKRVAERALAKGVEKVWFDRNGRKYHGRLASLADAAREAGLSF